MVATNTFAVRLPAISLVLCLTAGLLIFVFGNLQTGKLAELESERLGRALSAQLAEIIRQPVLHSDLVSLQVSVDHLVNRAEVAGAAIYNTQQRLLAQSGISSDDQKPGVTNYREALVIEGKTVAYAGVNIDSSALLARYQKPLNWILVVWAVFTVVITGIAYLAGRQLSRRMNTWLQRLPGEESPDQCRDELELLEQRLQPLLTQNAEPKPEDTTLPALQIATMALHCKNLPQLEQQLSKEKLQRLLNKLDDDLDQISALYDGQRRAGRDQTLFIEFSGGMEDGDHPMRALFCAHILLELAESYARSQGVSMDLSAAVKLSSEGSGNALLHDFEREKRETEVARLAHQGQRGETLLDSGTSLHHTLEDILTTEVVSESADLHKVASFAAHHQTLLEKQLRYLVEHPA